MKKHAWAALLFLALLNPATAAIRLVPHEVASQAIWKLGSPSASFKEPFDVSIWVDRMTEFSPSTASRQTANSFALAEIAKLRASVADEQGINAFRIHSRRDEAVKILVRFASSPVRAERLDATISLANVVDNTTLCYVLSRLAKTDNIDVNGRFNLLQVVRGVSTYAFQENEVWILQTNLKIEKELNEQKDIALTRQLISEIEQILSSRWRGREQSLANFNKTMYDKCGAELRAVGIQ
ncbi:hypothetical protein FBZ85_1234 [Azospirillum brasilense]|uniref:hypothetical protein n=1 Tax=Azospirillum baldaniorum TaxID=1064539 RepID=UPI001013D623|nr:hypothetical protein [Azospirillum baldaniorum]TWA70385.1 hypothetical protein FBZ85_1234 [Azospirillum brasilense]